MKLKIFIILFFAFLISMISSRTIFLANTPKVNETFINNIPYLIKNKLNKLNIRLANLNSKHNKSSTETSYQNQQVFKIKTQLNLNQMMPEIVLKSVSKGVMAGEYQGTKVFQYVEKDIVWKKYTFTLNDGQIVIIDVPEGQQPPSQKMVEALYK